MLHHSAGRHASRAARPAQFPRFMLPSCGRAGRAGRAEVVSRMRCSIARTTRASNAPRYRPLFPDWIRTCSAHPDGDQQGALGPSSPDFTGSARQQSPNSAGPRGFMPREQCKRRSLRPVECRSHRTSSTMAEKRVGFLDHRSDACRVGRCSDLPKVRCTSKSSLSERGAV